jgi:hypothetical protein
VVQRILGIALILDGRGRSEAASLVGLDPQSLARAVQHYPTLFVAPCIHYGIWLN